MTIGIDTLNAHYSNEQYEPVGKLEFADDLRTMNQSPATVRDWVVLGRLYKTTSVDMREGDGSRRIIDVVERKLDPVLDKHLPVTPVDINWALTISNHNESPVVHHGEIFRFRPLGNGPIMVMTKNRHRWDASSVVVATREDLMTVMGWEGFHRPWLIYGQTRLFPATPRIPDEAIANLDNPVEFEGIYERVSDLMHSMLNQDPAVTSIPYDLIRDLKEMGKRYRYLSVRIARTSYHRQMIGRIAGFINLIFFECGVVLLRRCDRDQDQPQNYVGRHGSLYHDFKLMVDRLAPFSNGEFSTGWAKWFEDRAQDNALNWHKLQTADLRVLGNIRDRA